ncbi:MAG TPA: LPS-assembly protein LptD [Devosia sp.]|nr:LPS-assembly protein LptD [Devosia sp.]
MRRRLGKDSGQILRLALASAALVLTLGGTGYSQALGPFFGIEEDEAVAATAPQLLPEDFFDSFPTSAAENIAVEADNLIYDADANKIIAQGNVQLSYKNYLASAERAVYDRKSGDITLIGSAVVRDPAKVIYTGDRIEVTGDLKRAFLEALAMQTPDGAIVTADEAEYRDQMVATLENGSYAPCGLCVDADGHDIGWRVRAAKIILNREEKTLYLEQPRLELVGTQIANLPFLWLPDPTDPRASGFRFPKIDYSQDFGYRLALPYFQAMGEDFDLWLTPMLMSQQGFLLDAELTYRFDMGSTSVRAAGLYQLDNSPFIGEVGDRAWRGAIQSSGRFTPVGNWRAGWSYLAFSDPGFIPDYKMSGFDKIDDIYLQYFEDTAFFDVRVQRFNQLGNKSATDQNEQGTTLPVARLDKVFELDDDLGQVAISGNFIGVDRALDDTTTKNGVPYVYGYAGTKLHGMVEATWSRQWIAPGGVVATPYLGLRADGAGYDGTSVLMPVASSLFSATPIAALDVRFPLIATDGVSSYLFEPIAQLVYRASSTSLVGITNDNAQGFVFEDSNLFSFNRFSGSDRQETGLRANVGGQFLANFADGSWLRLIGGQSYQLAGVNAYSIIDPAQVGNMSGLGGAASYVVAGASASFGPGVEFGGKIEVDPATASVARGAVALEVDIMRFTLDADYYYRAAQPARGELTAKHLIGADVGVPIAEYWSVTSGLDWNLTKNNWSQFNAGIGYDDEFLAYGAGYTAKQDLGSFDIEHIFSINLELRGPAQD